MDRWGLRRKRSAGFTLLELTVVISLIALLMVIAINKLWPIQVDAERVAMEQVLGSLRSALGMKFAQEMARGRRAGIRSLEGSNPMDLLVGPPGNYLGALTDADPESIEAGHWYFDVPGRALVYRVNNAEYFTGGLEAPARARFVVRLLYADDGRRKAKSRRKRGIEGVQLVALESYRWTD